MDVCRSPTSAGEVHGWRNIFAIRNAFILIISCAYSCLPKALRSRRRSTMQQARQALGFAQRAWRQGAAQRARFSNLPEDLKRAAEQSKFPTRRTEGGASSSSYRNPNPTPPTNPTARTAADIQREGAQIGAHKGDALVETCNARPERLC